MSDAAEIMRKLAIIRRGQGLPVRQVAIRMGREPHSTSLYELESGRKVPRLDTLLRYMHAIGLRLSYQVAELAPVAEVAPVIDAEQLGRDCMLPEPVAYVVRLGGHRIEVHPRDVEVVYRTSDEPTEPADVAAEIQGEEVDSVQHGPAGRASD